MTPDPQWFPITATVSKGHNHTLSRRCFVNWTLATWLTPVVAALPLSSAGLRERAENSAFQLLLKHKYSSLLQGGCRGPYPLPSSLKYVCKESSLGVSLNLSTKMVPPLSSPQFSMTLLLFVSIAHLLVCLSWI